ncbi:hypothetical protein [Larsenimonas rhizosphaerae]|uniref:Uncharacterized protein n=1 Tax=Larsenimonas rhizosphaerae TaxID=2944682 RepID=A0AA42CXH0_9GAMM|nr:hypothetical protein [Larsenimonas rhizosphaerae]MCM2131148.1 hypothetical protein [Larsenimonas rhizosphaerae]MCX2523853.1 hypothetical protein [Larsenimonas rhizosphaerae]
MPDQAPWPRKAEIVRDQRGETPEGEAVYMYELRGVVPEEGLLLSEHESEAEALDAKRRYESEEQ